jgi:predicted Zn-dependent peptidase
MEYQTHILDNGIRLIHKKISSPVSHLGVFINTGSRDELEDEHGMAHFIEHMIFKGTEKKGAFKIISRLEDVGGDINAYTAKEETCIHSSFLNPYYERAIELFSDILFNSTFPEKEIEKEKEVIVEEINSYKDSPAEQIVDDFEELIFQNHPIGRNILGTAESLKSFTREKTLEFIRNRYYTDETVICSVGSVPFAGLKKITQEYFGNIKPKYRDLLRKSFDNYKPVEKRIKKGTFQSHCIIGNIAYNLSDPRRIGLFLLNNILGGPAMNSRLNMVLREKYGYAYTVESFYTPYSDTGIIDIYFGTDNGNLDKCLQVVMKELEKLRTTKLGSRQLKRAKRQLTGQIAISGENYANYLLSMGKSFMVFNKVDTLGEICRKVEAVSSEQIQDIANEIFRHDNLSVLIFE